MIDQLSFLRRGLPLLATAVLVACATATLPPEAPHAGHQAMGRVEFPVSCTAAGQAQFTEAMAYLHHMTYPQARAAFERTIEADPHCAMAHWGVAMTLFQPLWPTRPSPADLRRGWNELQIARETGPLTEREKLFLASAEAFFLDPEGKDYWLRIQRWEDAAAKAYAALPGDPEAAVFYALAHLATTPPREISREHADRSAAILLDVYRKNPDHPGAMHYLVHANDVPGRERELLEITRRYESVAPRNPHALHMPTHIYTRLGDWNGVIRGNRLAADAALEHPAGDHDEFVWDEFPHAIEYLVYAHLQKGEDVDAKSQLDRLHGTANLEPTFKTAFHLSSTQARYALERRDWRAAAALEPRQPAALAWDRFTWPESIVLFARGLGSVHLGNLDEAEAVRARLKLLEDNTRSTGEELFARNIGVLHLELGAWIAFAHGDRTAAIDLMTRAAEMETSTPKAPVTPGPTLPAYELLGDLLREVDQPKEALAAYRRSLELYPNRFNSLLGAARAATAAGDSESARAMYEALLTIAPASDRRDVTAEARKHLGLG